ncbi:ComF family protein [Streptomyces spinoverrucosus]|uniref:ComF family protein n=1 Tax=Streptomyces spinoverrucosus TaxID=284043 RepID=UPI0018C3D7CD|nr:ComF family protein [Streptomyces spinoverrucosus]MBG0854824.1 ComF family protein [Streptomyces spinoverrucosus]
MRGLWQDLTDLVLPAECGGCGRPRAVLCPECRAALSGAVPRRVRPVPEPRGLPVVHAVAPYADEVRAVLLAHKERGALPLARPLGAALAGAVRAGRNGVPKGAPLLLVPVPSRRGAVRARGHDPARRIALAAAGELRRTGTSARVVAVLRQRRPVADQSGLDARQRLENLAGALSVAAGGAGLLRGGPVVLVDDVMTTGASLTEAARAVRVALAEETAGYGGAAFATRGDVVTAVYEGVDGERTGERMTGSMEGSTDREWAVPGKANSARDVICAAVIAASPDSFEINRN